MTKKLLIFIFLVVLGAAAFRLPLLKVSPPELFGDELDVGYQAYSLLKTGRDLYNQPLPVLIHSLSEWRQPVIVYQTVPSIAVFGLNEYGVRLPEVLMGIVSPIILFLLIYANTKSKSLAGFAAVAMSIMPWHMVYSRMGAFGAITLTNLIMLAMLLFQKRKFALSIIFLVLSVYTYNTAVIFLPLLFIPLLVSQKYKFNLLHLVLGGILLAPFVYHLVSGTAGDRFSQISLISDTRILDDIDAGRKSDPTIMGRIIYNRPVQYLNVFVTHYLQAFSTEFLFIRGDPVYRQSVQIVGEMLPIMAPFLLVGLCLAWRRDRWVWVWWLLIAPIASALTKDGGYHATRNFLMVIPLSVLVAQGALWLWHKQRLIFSVLTMMVVLQLANFSYYYFVEYPKKSWRWWQMGYEASMTRLAQVSPDFSRVFINNTYEPALIRFLFWTRYDPALFHREFAGDKALPEIYPNYNGFVLGSKYYFGQFSDLAKKNTLTNFLAPNSLYLVSQADDVPGDWDWRKTPPDTVKVLYTSTNPYDLPLFYLITKK